jgi:magnesium chelatase subunit I
VSVRLTIANYETMVANAARRALRLGETVVVPRVSDLEALPASMAGKVEIEALDEGDDGAVLARIVKSSVLDVFRRRCPIETLRPSIDAFDGGTVIHTGDDVASAGYVSALADLPALRQVVVPLAGSESPPALASALELVLEGLHLSRRLNKDAAGTRAAYRGRG